MKQIGTCSPIATEVALPGLLVERPPARAPQPAMQVVGRRGGDTSRGYPNALSGEVLIARLGRGKSRYSSSRSCCSGDRTFWELKCEGHQTERRSRCLLDAEP